MPGVLTAIVLLPLLGFLLNGVLATQLGGNRVGKPFVIGVGRRSLSSSQNASSDQSSVESVSGTWI